jgi:exopolyphosphatase/pppGpp-phosphohydrolase
VQFNHHGSVEELIISAVVTSGIAAVTLDCMRLAAIDVGSNSVHMIIADVAPEGHLEVVDRVKEMVRLGRRSFTTGRLTEESMDMAVHALAHFRRLADVRRVGRMRAVATSAVREAHNRAEFIKRIKRETGIAVEVISGADEAKLIFVAARHALGLEGGPHLLLDVGGGSAELVLVKDGRPLWMRSVKLGAARLTEHFLTDDPPTVAQRRRLEKHLEAEIGELMQTAKHAKVVRVIGTSGTINTMVAMARASRGEELGRLHGAIASAAEVTHLSRQLLEANACARVGGVYLGNSRRIAAGIGAGDRCTRITGGAPAIDQCVGGAVLRRESAWPAGRQPGAQALRCDRAGAGAAGKRQRIAGIFRFTA